MGLLSQRVFDSSDGSRVERDPDGGRGRRDRGPSRAAHRGDHRGVRGRHPSRPLPRGRGHLHRHRHRGPQGRRRQGDASSRWSRSPRATGVGLEEVLEVIEQCFPSPAAATAAHRIQPGRRHTARADLRPRRARWWPRSSGPPATPTSAGSPWSACSPARCGPTTWSTSPGTWASSSNGAAESRSRGIPTTTTTSASARSAHRSTTPPGRPTAASPASWSWSASCRTRRRRTPSRRRTGRPSSSRGCCRTRCYRSRSTPPTSATRTSSRARCSGSSPRT